MLKCPEDNLVDWRTGGTRGPFYDLKSGQELIYFSYAMNPNQPKNGTPIIPNTPEGQQILAPDPWTAPLVIERYNPGKITLLKQPTAFVYQLETQSPALLNPNSFIQVFRTDHGAKKDHMNLIYGDTHAEPRDIKSIWPGDFSTGMENGQPDTWPGSFRALWYGDPRLTGTNGPKLY